MTLRRISAFSLCFLDARYIVLRAIFNVPAGHLGQVKLLISNLDINAAFHDAAVRCKPWFFPTLIAGRYMLLKYEDL